MSNFKEVETWTIEKGKGLVLNGEPLGYAVVKDGPLVEPIDGLHREDLHILWVPMLASGPAPLLGPPENASRPDSRRKRDPAGGTS